MASNTSAARVAFLFPGQGAQAVGMGLDLYRESPAAKAVIDEVDEALGASLSTIIFEGPEEELRRTVNTQPGIMAVSLACLRAMEETLGESLMPSPSLVAGHSLGEYTSLVAAGALSAADGVRLVRERGRLMQYAAEMSEGAMAAILSMEDAALEEICRETDTEISNMNTPDQTVISGARAAVERAMELANERGARRTVPLPVAGAFHSRLMQPAQEGLDAAVAGVTMSDPTVPIVANCTGTPISTADEIRNELTTGLCSCVRWKDCVQHMLQSGINVFYEIGPGRILTGTVKRMEPDAEVFNVGDVEGLRQLAEALRG